MKRKPTAANIFNILAGIKVAIEPPASTPKKLARTRAVDEPRKTASGLFVVPLIASVASCVLSPSSARKMVVKVVNSKGSSILRCG